MNRQRANRRSDEQFWPVCLAMLALCFFSTAAISAYLTTEDPRWFANSWTWCFVTLATTCVLVGLLRAQTRWLRPTLQVSAVLCLLFHAVLFVVCVETNVFGRFWEELVSAAKPAEHEPLIEPDYQVFQSQQQQHQQLEQLKQPVAAATPDVERTMSRPEQSTQLAHKPIMPEAAVEHSEFIPNLLERREVEQTVPKFSEQLTRISRAKATQNIRPLPDIEIPAARQQTPVRDLATEPSLRVTRSRRPVTTRATAAGSRQISSQVAPASAELRPLARRDMSQPPVADVPRPAALSRSVRQPARIPEGVQAEQIQAAEAPPSEQLQATAQQPRRAPTLTAARAAPDFNVASQLAGLRQLRGRRVASSDDQPAINLPEHAARASYGRSAPGSPTLPTHVDFAGVAEPSRPVREGSPTRLVRSGTASGRSGVTSGPRRGPDAGPDLSSATVSVQARRNRLHSGRLPNAATAAAPGSPSRQSVGQGPLDVSTDVPLDALATPATGADEQGPDSQSVTDLDDLDLEDGLATGGSRKRSTLATVELPAIEDVGGLQGGIELNPGLPSRRASRESELLQPRETRFRRRRASGPPAPRTSTVIASEPYRRRSERLLNGPQDSDQEGLLTEQAIELGLAFLARNQSPDGRWSLRSVDPSAVLSSDTAATGLALLAFQGAGYSHREHQYAGVVKAAINYLTRHQRPDGDLFVPLDDQSNRSVWLYSHGIAALALTEAYGMTLDPELQDSAQRSIDFIAATQDLTNGGWRYTPGISSDTSVTGWMLMALKSAQLAELEVDQATIRRARRWFDSAQGSVEAPHLYRYNPFAPDTPSQRHGRVPSRTMTAVGLLMRLYDGWHRRETAMVQGAAFLRDNLPALGTSDDPQRDTYYWYYGTQVMFHMRGEYWQTWQDALRPLLVDTQIKDGQLAGSWEPKGPIPDRWAEHAGRLYVTTLNLLSLEVKYRYLPLYEETGR